MSDIHSKSLATDRFEDIVDLWGLEKAKVDGLHMRKVGSELELEAHMPFEGHVLDQDGHSSCDESLANTDR